MRSPWRAPRYEAGARWVVLCDTNGGTLPHEVERIVADVAKVVPGDAPRHPHPQRHRERGRQLADGGARRLPADPGHAQRSRRALRQRQPHLDHPDAAAEERVRRPLRDRRHARAAAQADAREPRARRGPEPGARPARALRRASAFATKAGIHASAIVKEPETYEHVPPESVGNQRRLLVSKQAGRSNILAALERLGIAVEQGRSARRRRCSRR